MFQPRRLATAINLALLASQVITLTGYGGVGEIGGNAFLLEAPGLRVMLDVGKRFGAAQTMKEVEGRRDFEASDFARRPGFGDYFDAFQQPRASSPVADLAALGLLPWGQDLARMYRADLGGASGAAPVDAVLVSHAHVDHCGLVPLLRPDVPVVTSRQTLATLRSIEETGKGGWEGDYADVRVRGGMAAKAKGGYGDVRYAEGESGVPRRFEHAARIAAGDSAWTVEAFDVDHSIQGASAFILTDGDTRIVYTGDFRQHGLDPQTTHRFLRQAEGCDVLVMEGTRVHGEGHDHGTDREATVEEELARILEQHARAGGHPFVGIGFPPRDLDRLRSLHHVARRAGRRLLVTTKQAHLLDLLRREGRSDLPDWRTDPNLGVFVRVAPALLREPGKVPVADKARIAVEYIDVGVEEWRRLVSKQLERWELKLLGGQDERRGSERVVTVPVPLGDGRVVTPRDVAREPGAYILGLSLFNMIDLFDIFPDRSRAGGLYVHSMTQPHNDDMEMDQFRLRRWLEAFGLNAATGHRPIRTHVSGHLGSEEVQQVLDQVRPKVLVPIHSERPDLTRDRYEARTGQRAVLPRWGHPEVLA